MAQDDRSRWNRRYLQGDHRSETPSLVLTKLQHYLPAQGSAVDLAGGMGRHAIWMAGLGLTVTLADISDVALKTARQRAVEQNVELKLLEIDLQSEPPPAGPWDVVVMFHYLHRPLLQAISTYLAPGGVLFFVQPTVRNLQRHEKPPKRFLLDVGEAPRLIGGLETIHYEEGWLAEGRHEAAVVAAKKPTSDKNTRTDANGFDTPPS